MVQVSVKKEFTDDRPHYSSIITIHVQFPDIAATPSACEGPKLFASDVMKHVVQRDALQLLRKRGWRRIEAPIDGQGSEGAVATYMGGMNGCIITYFKSFHTLIPELFTLKNILPLSC